MSQISFINPQDIARLNQLTGRGMEEMSRPGPPDQTFRDLMIESIDQVNNMQQDADVAVESLMTGGDVNPTEVLAAVQKADLTFKMMQQIRNKLVEAYQEIKEIRI